MVEAQAMIPPDAVIVRYRRQNSALGTVTVWGSSPCSHSTLATLKWGWNTRDGVICNCFCDWQIWGLLCWSQHSHYSLISQEDQIISKVKKRKSHHIWRIRRKDHHKVSLFHKQKLLIVHLNQPNTYIRNSQITTKNLISHKSQPLILTCKASNY